MTGKRRRRRKQLMDDLEERTEYLKLKQEALDRTLWRTGFGRGKIFIPSLVKVCNTKISTALSKLLHVVNSNNDLFFQATA